MLENIKSECQYILNPTYTSDHTTITNDRDLFVLPESIVPAVFNMYKCITNIQMGSAGKGIYLSTEKFPWTMNLQSETS